MHRILHIVPSLAFGGTATQFDALARGLPQSEFEVHLVAIDHVRPETRAASYAGFNSFVIGRRFEIDPLAFSSLRRHIQRLRPALVHTWEHLANTYGRAAALAAGVRHRVASQRHLDVWKTRIEFAMDRWLATRSDRIVVNSRSVRDFYLRRGVPANLIEVIQSGVAEAKPSPTTRQELLAELGLPDEARLIAYLGPLTVHKRLKELIWATDQLKAVGVAAHLLILGEGPLRQRLARYSRLNRVAERVHFLGVRDDAPGLLRHAEVLWQAGACEGQSNSILEAMAAGLPVVAADASGNRELVSAGETGFLVPLTERAGFARQTLPLLEDRQFAQRLGANGRQRVLSQHRLEPMLARYSELYRELLA